MFCTWIEQTIQIQSLKEERIKYLEQITQLYTALEKRESELVEFIQSYEQKANDVAQYMQEVSECFFSFHSRSST